MLLWSQRYHLNSGGNLYGIRQSIAQIALDVQAELDAGTVIPCVPVGPADHDTWTSSDALGASLTNTECQDRWRFVCVQHTFSPHPVAVHLTLTGTRKGTEVHPGMGAFVKVADVAGLLTGTQVAEPAYNLYPDCGVGTATAAAGRSDGLVVPLFRSAGPRSRAEAA